MQYVTKLEKTTIATKIGKNLEEQVLGVQETRVLEELLMLAVSHNSSFMLIDVQMGTGTDTEEHPTRIDSEARYDQLRVAGMHFTMAAYCRLPTGYWSGGFSEGFQFVLLSG